jgi:serine/threonine protein kinase
MWSLGCVAAELVLRKPLFGSKKRRSTQMLSQVGLAMAIFELLGTPCQEDLRRISGRSEPLLANALPSFKPPQWPPPWLHGVEDGYDTLLAQTLVVDPSRRLTAAGLLGLGYFRPKQLATVLPLVTAEQGLAAVQQGELDHRIVAWLQSDSCWSEFVDRSVENKFKGGPQPGLKQEFSGYVPNQKPRTLWINRQNASKPCESERLRRFAQEFQRCNRSWLLQLTDKVKSAVRAYPRHFLGGNGVDFLKRCFSDTAFAYATIQVMKPAVERGSAKRPRSQ